MNESVPKIKMSASSHAIGARHTDTGEVSVLSRFELMCDISKYYHESQMNELDEDMPSKINDGTACTSSKRLPKNKHPWLESVSKEFSKLPDHEKLFLFLFPDDGTACTSSKCLLKNKHPKLESLSKEFSELLHHQDHENHDVEFECEGESIKANGAIVSARSHVIASMITKGQQKIIKIPDMKLEIFKKFLAFLYSEESLGELSFAAACDLYAAGRKYAVYSLSTRCSDFLTENLMVHNGLTLVVLADSHGDDIFKEAALRVLVGKRGVSAWKSVPLCPHKCLICIIKRYLKTTMKTIQQTENLTPLPAQEINLAFDKVKQMTQETAEIFPTMLQSANAYIIYDKECRGEYNKRKQELFNQALRQRVLPLIIKFIELQQRTFTALSEFQNQILDTELIRWKQDLLLAGNGVPFDDNMDQRQEWCEDLADIISENHSQVKQVGLICETLSVLLPNEMSAKKRLLEAQFFSLLTSFVTRLVN